MKRGRDWIGGCLAGLGSELLAVFYGLASAVGWGVGDFCGAVATKRNSAFSVIVVSQVLGGALLLVLALLLGEILPPQGDMVLGAIGGVCGSFGVVAFYTALARGRMGVAAPVTAMVNAILPVMVGFFSEGLPLAQQFVGFGLALVAVWLISRGGSDGPIRLQELGLPIAAGVGFGLFFIAVDRVSESAILWPLVSARLASIVVLAAVAALRRQRLMPAVGQLYLVALAGSCDAGANALFALATRIGRLDIATVLSSLYPAGTVLLAGLILKERLTPKQWVGVAAALMALVLIAM